MQLDITLVTVGLITNAMTVPALAAQGAEWRFGAQSPAPIELPAWLPPDSLRDALYYDETTDRAIEGFLADINLDGVPDYVWRVSLDVCGSNCEYVLVDGRTHRTLGRVGGSVLFVRPPMINGYPVIHSYGHSSADAGYWSTSVFDGQTYTAVSSIFLEGAPLERLFATLQDIPFWPPRER